MIKCWLLWIMRPLRPWISSRLWLSVCACCVFRLAQKCELTYASFPWFSDARLALIDIDSPLPWALAGQLNLIWLNMRYLINVMTIVLLSLQWVLWVAEIIFLYATETMLIEGELPCRAIIIFLVCIADKTVHLFSINNGRRSFYEWQLLQGSYRTSLMPK